MGPGGCHMGRRMVSSDRREGGLALVVGVSYTEAGRSEVRWLFVG